MNVTIQPGTPAGTVTAPPSKSMAHRAVLCASLADGRTLLRGLGHSQDIDATVGGMTQLGARFVPRGEDTLVTGLRGFATVTRPVDCGESGSTLRFFIPLFSLTGQPVRFIGRGRLLARPQEVYADLFTAQGLRFIQDETGIQIAGALPAGAYTLPGDVSSQFISGLLFALPLQDKPSTIRILPPFESRSYVDLTLGALHTFGITADWDAEDENLLRIPGSQKYHALEEYTVEGDYSQAAFFAVLAALKGGITLAGLDPESLQGDRAILPILKRCGAKMRNTKTGLSFSAAPLKAPKAPIDLADCPDLGPILMTLACFCQGTTVITNARRLRLKESDRIAAMEEELRKFGAAIESDENTVTITGGLLSAPAEALSSHNDHRVVMSLTMAAAALGVPVRIADAGAINKSWPDFFDVCRGIGMEVTEDAE